MTVSTSLISLVVLFIIGYVLGGSIKNGIKTAMLIVAFIGFLSIAGILSMKVLADVFGAFHTIKTETYKGIFLSAFGSTKEEIGLNLGTLLTGFLLGFKK